MSQLVQLQIQPEDASNTALLHTLIQKKLKLKTTDFKFIWKKKKY